MISTTPSGTYPLPGQRLVDPVADVAHLERAPLHAAEADLTREAAVEQEEPEAVRGVEVTLAVPGAAPRPERLAVDGGIDAARVGHAAPSVPATPRQRRRTSRHASQSSCRKGRSITREPMSSVTTSAPLPPTTS